MPRKLERALSPRRVATAPPGMHADGGNLYLQVTRAANGGTNRSWIFRFGVGGSREKHSRYRDHGIGSFPTFSLSEARERARILRQQRADGIDPIEQRRAERAVAPVELATFGEEADRWLDAKAAEWGPTYQRAQRARLRDHVLPRVGKMAVRDVGVAHVTGVLDGLWQSRPNTAALVRMQLEAILDFAKVRGHREGENPARWSGHLRHVLGKTTALRAVKRQAEGKGEHHAALPYRDVGAFVAELRALPDDVAAWALEFCILTAGRTGEIVGTRWDEIDFNAKTWTVPPSRMKSGKEHRVPLSEPAVTILKKAAEVRTGDRVFPVADAAMLRLLRGRLGRARLTVHGFRSTFRDWCGECTAFPREVAEMCLAHTVGNVVEAAYRRGDLLAKRRALMVAWASFCARPAAKATNVVPLAAVR
jgi:integrase